MTWAIITIYISKSAKMNPQQLPETSKFYSRCKKCDIKKNLRGRVPPPLVARRLRLQFRIYIKPLRIDLGQVAYAELQGRQRDITSIRDA